MRWLASVTNLGLSAGKRPVEALLISDDPEFLVDGQEEVFSRSEVALGRIEHGAGGDEPDDPASRRDDPAFEGDRAPASQPGSGEAYSPDGSSA